jgi:D-3-phosphoglycerate dehydrogenase
VVVDPLLPEDVSIDRERMTLNEALPLADVLTLHCSGEQLLLGEAELARVKRGAILLNAARGGLADEAAVARALDDGRLAGAWIDTFTKEPYSGPLAECRNAVLTPHVGSYTKECRLQMETEAVENLLRGLAEATR